MQTGQDFSGKTLMITGGTGSFGSTILRRFLSLPISEIRIVSRDEKKQEDQRQQFADPRIKYHLADVRDFRTMESVTRGVDFLYHAAALKQVPSCEFHPMEAVATNVTGTANVLDAAIRNGVGRVVCLSTDKAVYPINAMGMSKALMEKVALAKARTAPGGTVICATRYGNVLASRGSVVPLFMDQVRRGQPLTLTDPEMTRFIMTLDEAVQLCLFAFEHGEPGDLFVQKAPAVTLERLARAVLLVMGRTDHPIRIIGARHGEKHFENLLSLEEMTFAEDHGEYLRIVPDSRGQHYDSYVREGEPRPALGKGFTSQNTRQLSVVELAEVLRGLPYVRAFMAGDMADAA